MTDRKAKHRKLTRAGFAFVSGWCRKTDAGEMQAKIDAAKADVDKVMEESK